LAYIPDQQPHSPTDQPADRDSLVEFQILDDPHVARVPEVHDFQDWTHSARLKRCHVDENGFEFLLERENLVSVRFEERPMPHAMRLVPVMLLLDRLGPQEPDCEAPTELPGH
jgi:hypothetical protein